MKLVRLEEHHLNFANNLRNKYLKYLRQVFPNDPCKQKNWFWNTSDVYWAIITENDNKWIEGCELDEFEKHFFEKVNGHKSVGIIGLTGIDILNRKAELSLITFDYLIPKYADFALNEVEKYFFEKLNGHKLYITAYEFDQKKNDYFSKRYKKEYEMIDNVCYDGIFYKEICYSKIKEV